MSISSRQQGYTCQNNGSRFVVFEKFVFALEISGSRISHPTILILLNNRDLLTQLNKHKRGLTERDRGN